MYGKLYKGEECVKVMKCYSRLLIRFAYLSRYQKIGTLSYHVVILTLNEIKINTICFWHLP